MSDLDSAWLAFNNWLIMNVGSVEAEQVKELVAKIIVEEVKQCQK